ncbi:hypothetical protein Q5752_003554 [Cryptotrichosporon argae]
MPAAATTTDEVPRSRFAQMTSTRRQVVVLSFFILFFAIDVALLGLISQQLHKYGNTWTNYPNGMYYHALGLGLFSVIFGLLFAIFHWAAAHKVYLFMFLALGVFFGTVAGILYATPFGHGLKCGNPVSSFPSQYQPFVGQCSRITAIEGLSWALFGLSVIGFFATIADKFEFRSKRDYVYAPYAKPTKGEKIPEGAEHV